MVSKMIR